MDNKKNKLAISTAISFFLVIVIWLMIGLALENDSIYSKVLTVVSLIPTGCYVIFGIKLLSELGVDKLYYKL